MCLYICDPPLGLGANLRESVIDSVQPTKSWPMKVIHQGVKITTGGHAIKRGNLFEMKRAFTNFRPLFVESPFSQVAICVTTAAVAAASTLSLFLGRREENTLTTCDDYDPKAA